MNRPAVEVVLPAVVYENVEPVVILDYRRESKRLPANGKPGLAWRRN